MMLRLCLVLALGAAALSAQQTLSCAIPVDGALSAATPTVAYTLHTDNPGAAAIRLISTTTGFSPKLTLTDPSGRSVSYSVSFTNGAVYRLASAGDYTVQVSSASSGGTGSFRIVMMLLNGVCGSTGQPTCGWVRSIQPASALPVQLYMVGANAGDLMSVRVVKTSGDSQASFAVLVVDANGQALPQRNPFSGLVRLDFQLPTTDPVNVIVFETSGTHSGAYSFGLTRLNSPCQLQSLSCGSIRDDSLSDPAGTNTYSLSMSAGDVYQLRILRTSGASAFQPSVEVWDPTGSKTTYDSHQVTIPAPSTGIYNVLVWAPAQTGNYSLSALRLTNPCNAQPLSCGSAADGQITGPLRSQAYALNATAGDSFLMRLMRTGAATALKPKIDIYDPLGNKVQTLATAALDRTTFTAASTGAYAVVASDGQDGLSTGSYSLSLAQLNRPCSGAALGCGSAATASIDGPLRFGTYSYNASPGGSFTARLLDRTGSLQPALEIYDPQGRPVGTAISGNSVGVDVPQPAGGTYTILAMDNGATPHTGPYAVGVLQTQNACGAAPPQGQSVAGVISGQSPWASYTVPASAGDQLLLRSASLTPGFLASMDLYNPSGARVASGTYALNRTIATTGPHTVVTSASDSRTTGNYALSWQLLNNPAETTPLACGQTLSSYLALGHQFRYYTVAGAAGDRLKVLLSRTSGNFAPQVEVFDSSGQKLTGSATEVNRNITAGGNYLVAVSPSSANGETGTFALSFQKPNTPCSAVALACGQSVLQRVAIPGDLDTFSFNTAAGDNLNLRISNVRGQFSPFLEVYDPSGALLRSGTSSSVSVNSPGGGAYALLVRDSTGLNTGTYRVALQRTPNACAEDDTQKPVIRLLRPTGGEAIAGGTTFRIAWESDDNVELTSHDISLSADGGQTFTAIASVLSGVTQTYDWPVPAGIAPSRQARIRVTATDRAGNSQSAVSDNLALIGSGFDGNGNVTYTYDPLNRITSATYQDGTVITYTYDPSGNLLQVTTAKP